MNHRCFRKHASTPASLGNASGGLDYQGLWPLNWYPDPPGLLEGPAFRKFDVKLFLPTQLPPVPALTDSARAVLRTLAAGGPTTRPQLSAMLSLSKPTMSAAVAELTDFALVAAFGSTRGNGSAGRSATLYGLGPAAGHVIGIDAGSTQVRAVAQTLDGRRLAEVEEKLVKPQRHVGREMSAAVKSVADTVSAAVGASFGPLQAIAIALPVIVSSNRPEITHKGDIETLLEVFGPSDPPHSREQCQLRRLGGDALRRREATFVLCLSPGRHQDRP